MNTTFSLSPSFYVKKYPSRCLFGLMFFYQGHLSLLRGYPHQALAHYLHALSLTPKAEFAQHSQILSAISTSQLFVATFTTADEYLVQAENLKVSVQFKESHGYLKLHSAIHSFAHGDFIETQRKIGMVASKYINEHDSSPMRYQVENLLDWSYFSAGDILLLGERMNSTLASLNGDEIPLGSMWYLELQSLCEILRGHFTTARQCLGSLGRFQKNHFGFYYQSSLMAFLLTCERKFLCSEDAQRYETMEKIIFSGRKLLERVQTCPIGMVSLFLISYSALAILIVSKEGNGASKGTPDHTLTHPSALTPVHAAHTPVQALTSPSAVTASTTVGLGGGGGKEKEIFRRGGGTPARLESIAVSCLQALLSLSSRIKCLGILCVTLKLKLACYTGKSDSKYTLEFFDDLVYTIEYQQFAFGLLFWHIEKRAYCTEFHLNSTVGGETTGPRGGGHGHGYGPSGGPGSECLVDDGFEVLMRKYHVPDHHFLINQERVSCVGDQNLHKSPNQRRGTSTDTSTGLDTTTVTPFSS
jgi:hypothetical protein